MAFQLIEILTCGFISLTKPEVRALRVALLHTWPAAGASHNCESPSLFSHRLSLARRARLLATTIVFGAAVPREASRLPVLWTELPVWTEGRADHLFMSSAAWKGVLEAPRTQRLRKIISVRLMKNFFFPEKWTMGARSASDSCRLLLLLLRWRGRWKCCESTPRRELPLRVGLCSRSKFQSHFNARVGKCRH